MGQQLWPEQNKGFRVNLETPAHEFNASDGTTATQLLYLACQPYGRLCKENHCITVQWLWQCFVLHRGCWLPGDNELKELSLQSKRDIIINGKAPHSLKETWVVASTQGDRCLERILTPCVCFIETYANRYVWLEQPLKTWERVFPTCFLTLPKEAL